MIPLLLMGIAALGPGEQLEAGQRCAAVKDSLERLVCYDRVFAVVPAPVAAPAPAAPAAAAVPAAPQATAPASPDSGSITAKVTGLKEFRRNVYRITLDDGAVWEQQEESSLFQPRIGNAVRVEKGALGSYRMALADGSGWVRVRRLR